MPKITGDKVNLVKELYINENKNLAEIAREVQISRPSVRKILRKANIRNITKSEYDFSDSINFDLFDQINDEKSAYFLGLMCADGNNYIGSDKKKYYTVSLALQERDVEILKKFKQEIAPKHTLYKVKTKDTQQDQYKIHVASKKLSDQLIKLGCVPRKSNILKMPKIPKHLMHHYVRGYFDGDGCVGFYSRSAKTKKDYKVFKASFSGSKYFCDELKSFLEKELDISVCEYLRKNKKTKEISVNGNHQILKLRKWMYQDATVFLERKFNKFKELEIFMKNR